MSANRTAKFKVATWAFTSGAKSMFANRTVKFQVLALCFKTRCAPQRYGCQTKQRAGRVKFAGEADE